MQRRSFLKNTLSLPALYEQNYMLFRLLVPQLPSAGEWFVLEAPDLSPVYLYRVEVHPYTSEWRIGHFFPGRRRTFAPDYTLRVYHDARLAEAVVPERKPVGEVLAYKLRMNRALGEWLEYCHRRGFRLNLCAQVQSLPVLS